jgi:hypothetical protein
MKNTKYITGIFQVLTGVGILGIWIINVLKGAIPEFQTEAIRIAMHLLAEAFTGVLLLVSGLLILLKKRHNSALFYLSFGSLFYTLIASPGYFAQKGQWGIAALFLVLLLTTVVILAAKRADDRI